jgi:hypothetical protein
MKKIFFSFLGSLIIAANSWGQSPAVGLIAPPTNAIPLTSLASQFGTNIPAELGPLLAALENNILQTLPLLAAVNDRVSLQTGNGTAVVSSGNPTLAANLGTTLATNLSQSLAVNLGTSLATPTTALIPSAPVPMVNGGLALTPADVNTGTLTNGAAIATGTRDTLRALLILQNDMQRILPWLNAVNAGAAVTNSIGSTVLTPTGR